MESISQADYFGTRVKQDPTCKLYSVWDVFHYNMIWWNIAFFLGLNFTHLDNGPMKHFTLDPSDMKNWGPVLWAMFFALIFAIVEFLRIEVRDYIESGVLHYYVLWATVLVTYLVWNTKRQKQYGKQIHVHHYTLALILMSFNTVQSPTMSVVHGFLHGMMLEGGCRWGFDPIWEVPEKV